MKTFFYAKFRTINSDWEYDRFASEKDCERYMNSLQKAVYPFVLRWEEVGEDEFLSVRAEEDRRYIKAMNAAYGIV